MTKAELIKDAARLTAEVKKLRAIGAEAEARLVQAELTTVADRPASPSLFREACERIADMLRQDDGEAFFEAEKFLKRHAPDLYDNIGISGGTCDLQMREEEKK